jgi:hypothetical protein
MCVNSNDNRNSANMSDEGVFTPVQCPDLRLTLSFALPVCQGDDAVRKIKAEFDDTYGQSWHVIVGKHFGSKVTHDSKMFVFFYIEVCRENQEPSARWGLVLLR